MTIRKNIKLAPLIVATLLSAFVALQFKAQAEVLPIEAFGSLPQMQAPQLSPNGRYLSSVQNYLGVEIMMITDLEGGKPSFIQMSDEADAFESISSYFWINNERLMLFINGPVLVGPKRNRMISRTSRSVAVNRDGSKFKKLPDGGRGARYYRGMIDVLPDDDEHVLVSGDNSSGETNVYKLNVYTGKAQQEIRGRYSVWDYRTNFDHEVVIRYHLNEKHEKWEPYRREPGSLNWTPVFRSEDVESLNFITFTSHPDTYIVSKKIKDDWREVYQFSKSQKSLGKMLHSFKGKTFGGMIVDRKRRQTVGYSQAVDYWKEVYTDPDYAKMVRSLESALPGQRVDLGSRNRDHTRFIVAANSERDPTSYYLYDRSDGSLSALGHHRPELEGKALFEVKKLQYKTRDDLDITAYLTLPRAMGPHKTIILPHGGPTARDYLEFDDWAQFLASRGYAVLQPNFRGSTGYGLKFQESGYGEWGLKMQDDVTDGTRHLINSGIADPANICIMGWSYGGYAALQGVKKEPDLYKCSVAGGAVTDMVSLLEDTYRYKNHSSRDRSIGHMKKDRRKLRENSPFNRADEIKVPVLIFHGEFDSVVDVRQGRKMAKALESTGMLHKYVELKNGDHHLSSQMNRMIFFKEVEAFLAEHL